MDKINIRKSDSEVLEEFYKRMEINTDINVRIIESILKNIRIKVNTTS